MRCVFLISDHAAQSIGNAGNTREMWPPGGRGRGRGVSAIRLAHCLQMIANFPVWQGKFAQPPAQLSLLFSRRRRHATRLIAPQLIPVFSVLSSQFSASILASQFSLFSAPNFSLAKTTHGVKISKYANFWR